MSQASPATSNLPIVIRQAERKHLAFIHHSWKSSAYEQQTSLAKGAFYTLQNALCDQILAGDPVLLVATPPDSDDLILGWVCAEAAPDCTIVHWCCVKSPYRRDRIATRLLDAARMMTVAEGAGPGKVHTMHTRHEPVLARHGWEHRSLHKALLHRTHARNLTGSAKRGTV